MTMMPFLKAGSRASRAHVCVPILFPLLVVAGSASAAEPTAGGTVSDQSEEQIDRSTSAAPDGSAADQTIPPTPVDGDEIVVTAPSGARGAARVEADFEIDAPEIDIHAADTINGLMEALAPRTGSARPVVLVNGERIPGGGGIGSYPPEAIERIQVLPPEAAAAYGYPPGQQLINIVLKRSFANWTVQAGAGGPMQGGRGKHEARVSRVLISGNNRWSFDLRAAREDMLREDQRVIPAAPSLFGFAGNVSSTVAGAEIDPALSALAGQPVFTAAVPRGLQGVPGLGDFLATANAPDLVSQAAYRSILPETHSLGLATTLVRPLGSFQALAQIGIEYNESEGLLGLPTAGLFLPAGHPFSPFSGFVRIDRAWEMPLRSRQSNFAANAGVGLNGEAAGWQVSGGTVLSVTRARSRTDFGADVAALQASIDEADMYPFLLPLQTLPDDASRTTGHSASINFNASRSVARLPAGPVRVSIGAEGGLTRTDTAFEDGRPDFRQRRESVSGRISTVLPVNDAEAGPVPALGGLTLQLSAGGDAATGEALRHQYSYGLNWSPLKGVDLGVAAVRSTTPPDTALLSAPLTETPNVRVYDFVTAQRVEVIRVDGGNPDLRAATRSSLTARFGVRPSFVEGLALLGIYSEAKARDGIGRLPGLTAAVEEAFPERVTRDPDGQLVRLDARSINIARATTRNLKSYLSFVLPIGESDAPSGASVEHDGSDVGTASMPRGRRGAFSAPANVLINLGHDWNIADRILLRPGLTPLDRLTGDGGASVPRHSLTASMNLNVEGMGVGMDARWSGASVARSDGIDGAPGTRLDFSAKTEIGLRLFGTVSAFGGSLRDAGWAKGLRVSLDVDNLFDTRVKVRDQDGAVPIGYTRDEIDPLGRTVKFSLRKML
jgi:hypothetical protein